jgi:DNA-binding GntR family transcriptional regulator
VRLTIQNIRDILQYRTMLECGCLDACFDKITPTQICRLEDIVEREFMYLSNLDPKDYWDGTLNFHLTLASYADNEYIYSQLRKALDTFMRAFLQFYWDKLKDNSFSAPSELHREIVNNIRLGNKETAIELLRQDINTLNNPKDDKGKC